MPSWRTARDQQSRGISLNGFNIVFSLIRLLPTRGGRGDGGIVKSTKDRKSTGGLYQHFVETKTPLSNKDMCTQRPSKSAQGFIANLRRCAELAITI